MISFHYLEIRLLVRLAEFLENTNMNLYLQLHFNDVKRENRTIPH